MREAAALGYDAPPPYHHLDALSWRQHWRHEVPVRLLHRYSSRLVSEVLDTFQDVVSDINVDYSRRARTRNPRTSPLPLSTTAQCILSFPLDLPIDSIDGVLLRSSDPIPRAHKALSLLQSKRIPFILLTNGGGKHESERVAELSQKLDIELDTSMIVQSHSPFADMKELYDKTILVCGGDGDACQTVAQQ